MRFLKSSSLCYSSVTSYNIIKKWLLLAANCAGFHRFHLPYGNHQRSDFRIHLLGICEVTHWALHETVDDCIASHKGQRVGTYQSLRGIIYVFIIELLERAPATSPFVPATFQSTPIGPPPRGRRTTLLLVQRYHKEAKSWKLKLIH